MTEPIYPKTVRRYRWRDWSGIRGDDEIVQADPDCTMLIRDGELIIVSDKEVAITI